MMHIAQSSSKASVQCVTKSYDLYERVRPWVVREKWLGCAVFGMVYDLYDHLHTHTLEKTENFFKNFFSRV